ncbi:hypothetical protein TSUD_176740 [Trifolium subterraneum]|uniref:Uncharacterized protein n=1 Tax=Trifolium subterraneum TaxID=3900 RepID=A0A2Z6LV49_TRISU|nr:hypothetical protein TSUD_176740 [Trifolium subterraneum]
MDLLCFSYPFLFQCCGCCVLCSLLRDPTVFRVVLWGFVFRRWWCDGSSALHHRHSLSFLVVVFFSSSCSVFTLWMSDLCLPEDGEVVTKRAAPPLALFPVLI